MPLMVSDILYPFFRSSPVRYNLVESQGPPAWQLPPHALPHLENYLTTLRSSSWLPYDLPFFSKMLRSVPCCRAFVVLMAPSHHCGEWIYYHCLRRCVPFQAIFLSFAVHPLTVSGPLLFINSSHPCVTSCRPAPFHQQLTLAGPLLFINSSHPSVTSYRPTVLLLFVRNFTATVLCCPCVASCRSTVSPLLFINSSHPFVTSYRPTVLLLFVR
jgi:hypothetical protein